MVISIILAVFVSCDEAAADDSCYILEVMCYYSSEEYLDEDSLKYAYYDKLLTGKAIRDPQSWKMLDIVFGPEGRVYDYAMALNINRIYSVLPNSVCTATYSWGSQKASIEQGFRAAIGDSLKQVLDNIYNKKNKQLFI